jgi:hypothetical protein
VVDVEVFMSEEGHADLSLRAGWKLRKK